MFSTIVLSLPEAVEWLCRAIVCFGPPGLKRLKSGQSDSAVHDETTDQIRQFRQFWKLAIAVVQAAKRVKELDASHPVLANYYVLLAADMVQSQTQINQINCLEQSALFEKLAQVVVAEAKLGASANRIQKRNGERQRVCFTDTVMPNTTHIPNMPNVVGPDEHHLPTLSLSDVAKYLNSDLLMHSM